MDLLKNKRAFDSLGRLSARLNTLYPLPEALVGYLFGILFAALSIGSAPTVYEPLPMKDALTEAISAELPFLAAAALLVFLRPTAAAGKLLILIKAACCGFGAELILASAYPTAAYYRYVLASLVNVAVYICLVRQARDLFSARRPADRRTVCDYLIRWLFYSGIALLLLPLKYFVGF